MILSTIETNGVVLALVMTASLFGWVLTVSQVPQKMSEFLVSFTSSRMLVLLIVNIFLLVVGMFMEATAAILILTPILIPVMASYGVDVTQGCLIMILNLMIGVVTPPVGVVLYIISNIAKVKFERVVKATLPFFIPLGITLALVTFVPFFTTFLPNLFYGTV